MCIQTFYLQKCRILKEWFAACKLQYTAGDDVHSLTLSKWLFDVALPCRGYVTHSQDANLICDHLTNKVLGMENAVNSSRQTFMVFWQERTCHLLQAVRGIDKRLSGWYLHNSQKVSHIWLLAGVSGLNPKQWTKVCSRWAEMMSTNNVGEDKESLLPLLVDELQSYTIWMLYWQAHTASIINPVIVPRHEIGLHSSSLATIFQHIKVISSRTAAGDWGTD